MERTDNTKIGIGVSSKLDSYIAGKDAAMHAFNYIGRHKPDIFLIFISTIFNQGKVMQGIASIIRDIPMVGCSTAGCITNIGSVRDSVAVCAISSTSFSLTYELVKDMSKDQRLSGDRAARKSSYQKETSKQVYIMLCDSLSGNSSASLRGAQEVLGTSFPIIGGGASDDLRFEKSYLYADEKIYSNALIGLLISGSINVSIGTAHGWQPVGKPHKITSANANVLKEIDGKRAVELYTEYLALSVDELKKIGIAKVGSSYPIGWKSKDFKKYLLMTPLKMTIDGSLTLNAEIPEGEDINFMIGDKNLLLDATKTACRNVLKNTQKSNIKFALIFSDIGRLQVLRKDSQKEAEIIKEVLGENVPFFGCYTYGEYVPIGSTDFVEQTYFQGQTISVTAFY